MARSTEAFVQGRGAALFTRVDGPDKAPWLFLSNSIAADHTMWDGQIGWLTRKYRVLRHDVRGHGRSDAPSGPYTFPMLIEDVTAIFDHYHVDRAVYMGLSMGAMIGIGFALAHADRVSRFICCDARADGNQAFVESWDHRIADVAEKGIAGILQPTLERWMVRSFADAHPEMVKKVAAMIMGTDVRGFIGCARMLKTLDYAARLPELKMPTLFVVGAEDTGAPPAVMSAMAGSVPGAAFAIVPHAAHLPNVDNSLGFQAATADFLGLAR